MAKLTTLDDLKAAQATIASVIRPNLSRRSDWLSSMINREVWIKPEQLQRTGSYKIRGATNHMSKLPAGSRVVAASAGNHAQGVAYGAKKLGFKSTVFMPATASLPKVAATRGYGADVELVGATVEDAIEAAQIFAAKHHAHYVPPFDDALVIAGQGTVGLEILSEIGKTALEYVVVPVGGGGLISGVAAAIKLTSPNIGVIGVQAEGAASMRAALDAGHIVTLPRIGTIADGIAVKTSGILNFSHAQQFVDDVVTVSDNEISSALVLLLERAKVVVEPAGAVGVAALLAGKIPGVGAVATITSGGNIDPLLLMKIIEQGLSASGRYSTIRVTLVDRPGQLVKLATAFFELGLNVIEIDYHRRGLNLLLNEVEIRVTVETRGLEHQATVIPALVAKGFTATEA